MRGTQNLLPSILASVILTAFSTLFNFYVMRRGALIVGHGRISLGTDLLRLPRLAFDFVTWLPRYLIRRASRTSDSDRPMTIKSLHITNSYHPASGGIRTFYNALLDAAIAIGVLCAS